MTIKEIRTLSEMTQKQFSEFLKIPKRTIENWETEKRKCPDYVKELIQYRIEQYIFERQLFELMKENKKE